MRIIHQSRTLDCRAVRSTTKSSTGVKWDIVFRCAERFDRAGPREGISTNFAVEVLVMGFSSQ
jgi:hypothetical protein